MDTDFSVNVALSREAKAALDRIVAERAIKQKDALGRIITWFTEQPPLMQAIMLQQVPAEYHVDLAELLIRMRESTDASRTVAKADAADPLAPRLGQRGTRKKKTGGRS